MRFLLCFAATTVLAADPPPPAPLPGNAMLSDYFAREVAAIEGRPAPVPKNAEEWKTMRLEWRTQLAKMLSLDPMPAKTPLQPVKTGEVEGDGFIVENLHFQSMPGLYVTANFYRPKTIAANERLPAILYVCGHSNMTAKDGGSLGNKAGYQHHGSWFARHGYTCLVIDTVQLGEIRGEHHGTYSKGRWWWISRGYTPAGIEAWNGIRALDYLETRPEVDKERIGITGRSGGGAYSWWVGALDDRVKVIAPTAGITTLRNHVVDGAVEGHCDCMYLNNTLQWDYDRVAALVAPRPLLISNTDKDTIFPLDGVVDVYNKARRHYRAVGAEDKIGLQIAEGPHKDTQSLNVGAFAWFERFLKGADLMATIDEPAKKTLDPEVLRVFRELPKDELNTRIDETFAKAAGEAPLPADASAFGPQAEAWMRGLREQVFANWPRQSADLRLSASNSAEHDGIVLRAWDYTPQEPWTFRIYIAHRAGLKPSEIEQTQLHVLHENGWTPFHRTFSQRFPALFQASDRGKPEPADFDAIKKLLTEKKAAVAYFAPRGVGPTAWSGTEKQHAQRLRRFYLLGQTLDGMRVWDIRSAVALLRAQGFTQGVELHAEGVMAGNALYASLFENGVARLSLVNPAGTHRFAPIYLNVLRVLDVPQTAAMVVARAEVRLTTNDQAAWKWTTAAATRLGRVEAFKIIEPTPAPRPESAPTPATVPPAPVVKPAEPAPAPPAPPAAVAPVPAPAPRN